MAGLGVAGLGLDLTALRSLVPLVEWVPLRMAGNMVGHVREPLLIRRELFAQAEIADAAFEAKLSEWELRGRLHTAVSLRINGRTAPTAQADGEPSHVSTAVASIDVVDLPRTGGCFFGATLPGMTVPVPAPGDLGFRYSIPWSSSAAAPARGCSW